MGDPNAAPVPDPRDDGADRAEPPAGEAAWTDEWAERQWNDIVAELTSPGTPDGSAQGTRTGLPPSIEVAPWVSGPGGAPRPRAVGPRDWPTTPEQAAAEEADDHFVPPEPPHLLGHDPLANLAWGMVALAPLVVLVLLVVVRPFPRLAAELAGAAFLAGVAILVWRMPGRRDDDHDGTGAVV